MGLVLAIIIGGIIGWLASSIAGRKEGVLGSIVIGMIGAVIGNLASGFFGSTGTSILGLTWQDILWTFVGALIFSIVLNAFQHHGKRSI